MLHARVRAYGGRGVGICRLIFGRHTDSDGLGHFSHLSGISGSLVVTVGFCRGCCILGVSRQQLAFPFSGRTARSEEKIKIQE